MPKSQIETDQIIINFLGDVKIKTSDDLILIRNKIHDSLEFRPYNEETQEHADSVQWKRTASEILKDKYVYKGRACSDLVIVFIALCKAANVEALLVKLIGVNIYGKEVGHSIAEVKLNSVWYTFDLSTKDSIPKEGELTDQSRYYKIYKVWKKGRDLWDLGLYDISSEDKIK
ncbi:transglutaminase domain-containing protein [Candidatus Falkowbacteria bacterium]|jgi:hypothetical protein|nr:transglutaminase domain-containing protein [Candidatus Falkowbacteria bacterium]